MPHRTRNSGQHRSATKKGPRIRTSNSLCKRRTLRFKSGERHKESTASEPKSSQLLGSALLKKKIPTNMRANTSIDTDSDITSSSSSNSSDAESAPASVATTSTHVQSFHNVLTSSPPITDELKTKTSELQEETIAECLPYLKRTTYISHDVDDGDDANNSIKVINIVRDAHEKIPKKRKSHLRNAPELNRKAHIGFLRDKLGSYPWYYAAMDASRPWVFYWALNGLVLMGEDVGEYTERLIYTLSPCQNKTGGFAGGHGQLSHLATSYAAVLSLLITRDEWAYKLIDRKAMWHWLGQMKQRDGGFTLVEGGEEDIRGAYCALTIISLLNLPLDLPATSSARVQGNETFLTGLMDWIRQCQTYEGGLAGAPGNEAHGSYTFCGLACLCIVGPPHETIKSNLNLDTLITWLSSRQYAPEGGFAGRTNKLVDGCYSHWAGGCWALVEAALPQPQRLWSPAALERYILCCCQAKKGGLRDKPSKPADAYHTCYNLAGLSSAQHRYTYKLQPHPGPSVSLRPANDVATTVSNLDIRDSDGEKVFGLKSLSSPPPPHQQQQSQSPSTNQPLFSSTLSAPYYWHVDADETENENKTSSASVQNGDDVVNVGKCVPEDREGGQDDEDEEDEEDGDVIGPMHPVFVIPWGVAEQARRYFEDYAGF